MFVAMGYFWLVRHTLSYSVFVFVSHKVYLVRLFALRRLLPLGAIASLCPY